MDVSYFESSIDWNAAKAAGIDFAFIRVTDGSTYQDPAFADYWAGARAAGVIRGAYQFFRPDEDPIVQADLLLSLMGPLLPGDLPPTLDVEVAGTDTPAEVATAVQAWVAHVTAAIGRPPIIYTGFYFWRDSVDGLDETASPLWHAQYTSDACPDIAAPWTQWAFWQYSDSGSVDGVVSGGVDLDEFNGSLAELQAFAIPAVACTPISATGGEIDDGDGCFVAGGPPDYLRYVTDAGEQGDLIWTHATDAADEANFAQWNLTFTAAGDYEVEVYTAAAYAQSKQAAYQVTAAGSGAIVLVDQTALDGWQSLGDFAFASGSGQSIHLGDNTGEPSSANIQLVFDAVRLTRVDADSGSGSDGSGSDGSGGNADNASGGVFGACDAGGGTRGGGGAVVLALGVALVLARRRR